MGVEDEVSGAEMRDSRIDGDERRERIKHHQVASVYNAVYKEQRELCKEALKSARTNEGYVAILAILESMKCPEQKYIKQP